jgi:GT2 family glycosyltransferase
MKRPLISVCILAGRGAVVLDACLKSLQAQTSAPPFELLVGRSLSPQVDATVRQRFPSAQLCDTGRSLPGAARNLLIERARGELLLFVDDDVTLPADLLSNLAETAARYPEASVFGGPNDTPAGSSRFEVVQGAVLSSLIGAGPVSRRYGARSPGYADERWFTLCNLAVRRRTMLPFLIPLVCAEENALLAELRARGEKMRYEPSLRVFHARRSTISSFAKQMHHYGRGRGQLIARRPNTFRLAYLAPVLLLINLALVVPMLVLGVAVALALGPIAAYGALVAAGAMKVGWSLRQIAAVPLAVWLVLVIHTCYALGVIRGLLPYSEREQLNPTWIPSTEGAAAQDS